MQKKHRSRVSQSFSAPMLLPLSRLLFAQFQISLCEISCVLRVNYFLIQILCVSQTSFLLLESNSLSLTAAQQRCVKESLIQSQDCGNSVFSQSKSYLRISIYLYWFYVQYFIDQLPLYNTKSVFCLRRVSTLLFSCQKLIQNACIIWDA